MKRKIESYTVIIRQEKRTGTNKICYSAFVPLLGVATEADTIEQVQQEIQSLVQFHLDSLKEEGGEIPVESKPTFVTKLEANLPEGVKISFV